LTDSCSYSVGGVGEGLGLISGEGLGSISGDGLTIGLGEGVGVLDLQLAVQSFKAALQVV
jgi:hypothetical protein